MKMHFSRAAIYGVAVLLSAVGANVFGQSNPPLPVKVTNTDANPVPVTGSVTVASSTNAPVNVTGSVAVTGSVTVANVANSPLTVRDLNSVAKTPIQLSGSCSSTDVTSFGCARIINYSPPTGKILMIEYVSTRYSGPAGTRGQAVVQSCMVEVFGCRFQIGPGEPEDRRSRQYLDPTEFTGLWSADTAHAGTSQKVLIFSNDRDFLTVYGQCGNGITCINSGFYMDVTVSGWLINAQ